MDGMRHEKPRRGPQRLLIAFDTHAYTRRFQQEMTEEGIDRVSEEIQADFKKFLAKHGLVPFRKLGGS